MTIAATTTDAVFTAAATATRWKSTNLGLMADVSHAGDTWTVVLPRQGDDAQATKVEITWRESRGGTEHVGVPATWPQTMKIVDAAMAATRTH
ncbi:hypothetical protein ACFV4P_03055 [Kitasatospora sp. NPDC059795]|uniref:hypothetical protein n=1 Tax=Kitasatospora sp. NPDC059795 TaxID=3346949 RepID=UPI0036498730